MNNKKSSIDGFIPRRPGSQIGELHSGTAPIKGAPRKELKSEVDLQGVAIGAPRRGKEIGRAVPSSGTIRSDIDDALRQLDEPGETPSHKMSRREKRRWKKENRTRAQRVRRRIIVSVFLLIVAAALAAGGYLAYKTFRATGNVLNGNIIDLIQHEPLKQDANGRSNFLILGTSEDDPGHDAGYLTDSIMVLSISQDKKDAYMFNIPRDLYVEYGRACPAGYRSKINTYFSCANEGTDDAAEQDRLLKTQSLIGDIVGLDIQYGIHVNYTVMRDVVNAIGGSISVTIESRNSLGVMDSNFDWKCGASYSQRVKKCPPDGHFIQYPNGPVTLDAEHALYLAQARGDSAPTYGFEQSNFDRERNQQKIAVAIRDKALSSGTLTNLGAVTGLIDALGNNLRTNIQTKELRTLMEVAQGIKNENIKSIDLYAENDPMFTTGPINGESSVYPKEGLYKYAQLQAFIQKELSSDPFVKEAPHIIVLNGSGQAGVAQTVADSLKAKGFTIDGVDNAPDGTYLAVEIYQVNSAKTATAAKLKDLYGTTIKTTTPPVSVTGETDFVIIIGDANITH